MEYTLLKVWNQNIIKKIPLVKIFQKKLAKEVYFITLLKPHAFEYSYKYEWFKIV